MPGHPPAPSGRNAARERSDLDRVRAWWRALGGDGFVVLPPPTRSRYTQSDGHEDAAELFAVRGLGADASFAYWHWQSHQTFDRSGALTGELMLHWGGDHATVAAGLGAGPAGYKVVDGGPEGAFRLDKVTCLDGAGLPDPADPVGVRQFLDRIDTPVDRTRLPYRYSPLTEAETGWLHDRLRDPVDVSTIAPFVAPLEHRNALTHDEASLLLAAWRDEYAGRLTKWGAWAPLLHALLRHDHPAAWETVAALGPDAAAVLGRVPSERGLAVVRELALAGAVAAIAPWLAVHRSIREPDWVRAASALATELIGHDAPEASLRVLSTALTAAVTAEWRDAAGLDHRASRSFAALAAVRFSTDERLPRELRVLAAGAAVDQVAHVREEAARLGPAYTDLTGTAAADALAAADRYEAARDELLAGSGPDLTAYEGSLGDVWHRYRTPSEADLRWLRARVADERTGMQGLGFCLELLYAHGAATAAEVDALVPRWKKVLTKQYRTTYTEWRHPLVTLTCLALELGHPVAADLLAWWAKPKPLWKNDQRLLTHLGAPDEAKAAELWAFVTSGRDDSGHLMTWVLLRARLDGVHPLRVADGLFDTPSVPEYVRNRVLIGVADPAQPLWHYAVDARSRSWWQRALEVADHPELSARARDLGLRTAREHCLIRRPDQVRPAPTEAELATARAWIDARA